MARCKRYQYKIYLMNPVFVFQHGIGTPQWVELIQSTADGNQLVQLEFVEQLVSYYDMEEAARWAKHYALPLEKLPHQIVPLVATAKRYVKFSVRKIKWFIAMML